MSGDLQLQLDLLHGVLVAHGRRLLGMLELPVEHEQQHLVQLADVTLVVVDSDAEEVQAFSV